MEYGVSPLQHTPCLQLRAGVYYFRQRLPRDIASWLDKREIVRSLKTSHYPAALERKTLLEAALKRAMTLLRETDPKDVGMARALFRRWFENHLHQDLRRRRSTSRIKLVEEPYPSSPLEEMAWIIEIVDLGSLPLGVASARPRMPFV